MENLLDKRDIRKRLWKLSYPSMISFMLQSVYDIVDMIWVGRISKEAVAGVTLFTTVFWLFTFFNEVIGMSSISLISQSHGKNDVERTRRIAERTIGFKAFMGLVSSTLLILFLIPILKSYGTEEGVFKAALDYGYIRIFFLPIMFCSYSVNTIFRCSGDSKTPMYIMILSAILNMVLDPLLMFDVVPFLGIKGMGLGVFGAAVATVVSTTISFLVGFYLLVSGKKGTKIRIKGLFVFDKLIDKALLTIGLPSGFEVLLRYLAGAIIMWFVTAYGTAAVSVAGIGSKLFSFAFMPISGFMMGGSTIVGMYLGRDEIENAETAARVASRLNLMTMIGLSIFACIFAKDLIRIFIDDVNVINMGVPMIYITCMVLVVAGYSFGRAIVFGGSGYNFPLLISSLVSRWFMQVPFLLLVVNVFHLPIIFVWLSYCVAELGEFSIILYNFKKGAWKYNRV